MQSDETHPEKSRHVLARCCMTKGEAIRFWRVFCSHTSRQVAQTNQLSTHLVRWFISEVFHRVPWHEIRCASVPCTLIEKLDSTGAIQCEGMGVKPGEAPVSSSAYKKTKDVDRESNG